MKTLLISHCQKPCRSTSSLKLSSGILKLITRISRCSSCFCPPSLSYLEKVSCLNERHQTSDDCLLTRADSPVHINQPETEIIGCLNFGDQFCRQRSDFDTRCCCHSNDNSDQGRQTLVCHHDDGVLACGCSDDHARPNLDACVFAGVCYLHFAGCVVLCGASLLFAHTMQQLCLLECLRRSTRLP